MNEAPRIAIPDEEILAEAWDRLRHVHDPELGVDLVGLGLIHRLELADRELRVEMSLTTPGCPPSETMPIAVERALGTVPAVSDVRVDLVREPPWAPEMMSDRARRSLGRRRGGARTMARLDVRPVLAAGGDPFEEIMGAVASLADAEDLELVAPLDPIPLYQVLGAMGFAHETRALGGGDFQVVFHRPEPAAPAGGAGAGG